MNSHNTYLILRVTLAVTALIGFLSIPGCDSGSGGGSIGEPPLLERPDAGIVGDGRLVEHQLGDREAIGTSVHGVGRDRQA